MSETDSSTTIGPTRPPRWVALSALCLGSLMVILDGTIVSIALPAIQADLGFSPAGLAWTVNAYLLPLGGLLLLAGRLGDLLGRRRMLLAGLALFVLASSGPGRWARTPSSARRARPSGSCWAGC
jgi:MFS family permease